MSGTNDAHLQPFIEGTKAGEPTMRGINQTMIAKEFKSDGPESGFGEDLNKAEYLNTRSNKAFALICLRRYLKMPTSELETMHKDIKKDTMAMAHRKERVSADLEILVPCEELPRWPSWVRCHIR